MRTLLILFLVIYFVGSYGNITEGLKENVINKIQQSNDGRISNDYFLNDDHPIDNKNENITKNEKINNNEEVIITDQEPEILTDSFDRADELSNQGEIITDKRKATNIESDFYESFVKLDDNLMVEMLKDNLNMVSMEDKLAITAIVLNNFSIKELNLWRVKAADGLSAIEKDELKSFVYERISEDDLNKIKALVKDN